MRVKNTEISFNFDKKHTQLTARVFLIEVTTCITFETILEWADIINKAKTQSK